MMVYEGLSMQGGYVSAGIKGPWSKGCFKPFVYEAHQSTFSVGVRWDALSGAQLDCDEIDGTDGE